jgi:hypothetical protein
MQQISPRWKVQDWPASESSSKLYQGGCDDAGSLSRDPGLHVTDQTRLISRSVLVQALHSTHANFVDVSISLCGPTEEPTNVLSQSFEPPTQCWSFGSNLLLKAIPIPNELTNGSARRSFNHSLGSSFTCQFIFPLHGVFLDRAFDCT